MKDALYLAPAIALIAVCTWITRAAPHLLFGKRGVPARLSYLAGALPEAIMVVLVVYCLRDARFLSAGGWAPQAVSVLVVVVLQIWKKSAMRSIFAGTAVYMVLIRLL